MIFPRVASLLTSGGSRIASSRSLLSANNRMWIIQSLSSSSNIGAFQNKNSDKTPSKFQISYRAQSTPCFAWEKKMPFGVSTPEELQDRIGKMLNLATEAQSCISDCVESLKTEHYEEELESAKLAVEAAGVAYSELLEELAVIDGGVEVLNEVRKMYSPAVESLRQELKNVEKMGGDE